MFKVIEQQHRSELQSQYLEHQKILQEMQKNMEKELLKQQNTLKQRLMSHREVSFMTNYLIIYLKYYQYIYTYSPHH